MAFRFTKVGGGGARGVAWQWLRAFFLEDWTLKILALLITLGLWYAVTTQRAPAAMRVPAVPLEFILPENVDTGNDPTKQVEVTLEGSQSKLAELNVNKLVARADVTNLRPGDRVVRLADNVKIDLPEGVRVVEVSPRSVALHLEPVVVHAVPVEARFEGELPEGFERLGVEVAPPQVRLRGPESHVQAIERVYTETISLAGRRETSTEQAAIDIPDHKVTPLDPTVSVRVEIAEEQLQRRFTNVSVRSAAGGPATPAIAASVTLRGPRSVVENLRPEDVRLVVEAAPDGTPTPRLSLPPSAAARVELVSTSPSEFTINK
ncbi:MAG TPA: CdaR family protein [Pyrinomonadaceae bacterium]|nr:CdaR family protein [Pyrinomonadaceae bacterium]